MDLIEPTWRAMWGTPGTTIISAWTIRSSVLKVCGKNACGHVSWCSVDSQNALTSRCTQPRCGSNTAAASPLQTLLRRGMKWTEEEEEEEGVVYLTGMRNVFSPDDAQGAVMMMSLRFSFSVPQGLLPSLPLSEPHSGTAQLFSPPPPPLHAVFHRLLQRQHDKNTPNILPVPVLHNKTISELQPHIPLLSLESIWNVL